MITLKCPVCGNALVKEEKSYRCENGHSYDIAKQGYVNLLMSNKTSAKRHGDDKAMVRARTAFLEKGYYKPLLDSVVSAAVKHTPDNVDMLDCGCGEGWYSLGVKVSLEEAGKTCCACGIDISRNALIGMSKRGGDITLAVAGINALPLFDSSCDLILNIFAPDDPAEFARVLRPGGILIRAVPAEDHLMGLKAAVYDKPYLNPRPEYSPDGFEEIGRMEIRDRLILEIKEDIADLFMMTPYYYKTGREDQQKLLSLSRLVTGISFCVFVMKKRG